MFPPLKRHWDFSRADFPAEIFRRRKGVTIGRIYGLFPEMVTLEAVDLGIFYSAIALSPIIIEVENYPKMKGNYYLEGPMFSLP